MLGGVQATSISMVVVMLESTSNAHFLIPIVVAGLAAKLTSAYLGGEVCLAFPCTYEASLTRGFVPYSCVYVSTF